LGFDCGRADGIFGTNTLRALSDFQQNYGLTVDGICGVHTIRALERTSSQSGLGPGIVAVREYETLLTSADHNNRPRILVGSFSHNTKYTRLLVRELRAAGDDVVTVENDNPHAHAQTANSFAADIYFGVVISELPEMRFEYYQTDTFVSAGGKLAAELCAQHIGAVSTLVPEVRGMQLPVLRETRMPAVVCTLGPRANDDELLALISPLREALASWCDNPFH
jgi:N-acetylmuramoyl-L-alanine amidase